MDFLLSSSNPLSMKECLLLLFIVSIINCISGNARRLLIDVINKNSTGPRHFLRSLDLRIIDNYLTFIYTR